MDTFQQTTARSSSAAPPGVHDVDGGFGGSARTADHAGPHADRTSLAHLLRQLTEQVTTLFTTEMALARSELRHAVGQARAATISAATGAMVLFGGFLLLLLAGAAALAEVVEPWLAGVIVGGITTVVGLIMVYAGKSRLEPAAFRPERTAEQLRRDREMAKAEFTHGASR